MTKATMDDVNAINNSLKNKLQIIINSINANLPKPSSEFFTIDDAYNILSTPEIVGSLASEIYPKIDEFENSCNETNCEPEVLDIVRLYAWLKVYNEVPEQEIETELIKNLQF